MKYLFRLKLFHQEERSLFVDLKEKKPSLKVLNILDETICSVKFKDIWKVVKFGNLYSSFFLNLHVDLFAHFSWKKWNKIKSMVFWYHQTALILVFCSKVEIPLEICNLKPTAFVFFLLFETAFSLHQLFPSKIQIRSLEGKGSHFSLLESMRSFSFWRTKSLQTQSFFFLDLNHKNWENLFLSFRYAGSQASFFRQVKKIFTKTTDSQVNGIHQIRKLITARIRGSI